jgi:hypothetical protein
LQREHASAFCIGVDSTNNSGTEIELAWATVCLFQSCMGWLDMYSVWKEKYKKIQGQDEAELNTIVNDISDLLGRTSSKQMFC